MAIVLTTALFVVAILCINYENNKWQSACDELDIEIRWHEMTLDGVTTNWVEMIDLRDNEIRKAR